MPQRTPWRNFPEVIIAAREQVVKQHPSYTAAKTGSGDAAALLVEETLPSEVVLRIKTNWQTWQPVLLSAHAEEELGRNAIPQALAAHLGARLGWDVDDGVVQANVVNHTGAGGFARLARPALFAGVITAGQNYLLVDDFIGQGGTLANMRGFVESNGGLWWEPLP